MSGKYNIPKEDLKALFSIIDMEMKGKYFEIYKQLGCKHATGTSFICINQEAHSMGQDANPSMSISNETGQGHCFTCGIKFNLPSFYKEWVAGTPLDQNEGSFTSFMVDYLHLDRFVNFKDDPENRKSVHQVQELFDKLKGIHTQATGEEYVMPADMKAEVKKETIMEMKINDEYVDKLLTNDKMKDFLKKERNIDESIISKYRLGYNGNAITFPMINENGELLNIKAYRPWSDDRKYKWSYPFPGGSTIPTPMINLTHNKIYFMEGEPDAYCAIAFGVNAVTLGSASSHDVNKIFGEEKAKQIFTGKEIIICLDADDTGMRYSKELADSLYQYAKQIKIIDLNKSETNPYGLDPKLMKDVGGKQKRAEKDFTDFLKKNNFNETSIKLFLEIEINTKVYIKKDDRKRKECFKVTLQEARLSRYYSDNGNIELDLIASVNDVDNSSFKCPNTIEVSCACMKDDKLKFHPCKACSLPNLPNFGHTDIMTFKLEKEKDPSNKFSIKLKPHDALGLIETTENLKNLQERKLLKINDTCKDVIISETHMTDMAHVRLIRDIAEVSDSINSTTDSGATDIDMEAYIINKQVYQNISYRFKAVLTLAWNGQHAVLYATSAEPISTSIESFKMNEEINETLQMFKPKKEETTEQALARRYKIFSNASGINNREDLFFINDLAYFSPIKIDNKTILPAVTRGWVEVLIAGASRCGKTIVSRYLHNHYKIGEFIGGSSAVTRTGLIGSVEYFRKKPVIRWGKFPLNDNGLIILDELSILNEQDFEDLRTLRSEGIAEIVKVKSAKTTARVRKIMLSNKRSYTSNDYESDNASDETYGIKMLKKLCFKDEALARFDIAYIVSSKDVKATEMSSHYEKMPTEFTEYQCQTLIKWAWSRKSDQVVFEDGFEDALQKYQESMMVKFHESTQLVNQEMRAKLARLSISLATMLFSTPENDYNKILVTKEHVGYMADYLTKIYCHPNMQLDRYSRIQKKSEELGDVAFMMNILKYTDINLLTKYEEFTIDDLHVMFAGYLSRVIAGKVYLIDFDGETISGRNKHEILPVFAHLLLSRNCIAKVTSRKYKKTEKFNTWLSNRIHDMEEGRHVEQSDVLETTHNESLNKDVKEIRILDGSDFGIKKQANSEF